MAPLIISLIISLNGADTHYGNNTFIHTFCTLKICRFQNQSMQSKYLTQILTSQLSKDRRNKDDNLQTH